MVYVWCHPKRPFPERIGKSNIKNDNISIEDARLTLFELELRRDEEYVGKSYAKDVQGRRKRG